MVEHITVEQLLRYFSWDSEDPVIQITTGDWDEYASMRSSNDILKEFLSWRIIELGIITDLEELDFNVPYAIRILIAKTVWEKGET